MNTFGSNKTPKVDFKSDQWLCSSYYCNTRPSTILDEIVLIVKKVRIQV